MPAPPNNEITQSIQEAESLWKRRQIAIDAPYFTLHDLAHLDSRLNTQLDILRQNSAKSWASLEQQFNGSQYKLDDLFPATVLAFNETAPQGWRDFLFELIETDERQITALINTLGWLPLDSIKEYLLQFLEIPEPLYPRIAIATCAHHRADVGDYLTAALQSDTPELRICALKAAGELGRLDLLPALREHLTAESPDWRFWAAWSAIRMGERGPTVEILSDFALTDSPLRQLALPLIARILPDPQRQRWLETLKETAANSRDAITSIGAAGDPGQIPWLIEHMQHPDLARAAGEAFTLITGLDLVERQLAQPDEITSTNPKNPVRGLPRPNPDAIKTWWQANENRFQRGTRYLLGRPITPDHCLEVLVNGYQRQRTAAALELALIQTGMPLFAVHTPAAEQQDLLNIRDTLQSAVETAAQLWLERDKAVHAPMITLQQLTELDGQLEQQLTLLREAGDLSWKCCWERLTTNPQPGSVFTAGVIAVSHADETPFNQLVAQVEAAPDSARELIAALSWVSPEYLRGRVRNLLAATSPLQRYVGITVCAMHRVDPGKHLDAALRDSGLQLRARALRTVGELRVQRHLPVLRRHLEHPNDRWQFWAAWAMGLLCESSGLKKLQKIVEHDAEPVDQQRAIDLLARAMEHDPARVWIRQLLLDERLIQLVIRGLGMLGDPSAIPWLIRCMAGPPEQAGLAGESFSLITGVNLIEQGLIEERLPEASEDSKSALRLSRPCPNPQAVAQWWSQQRRRYKKNRFYLMGFPISLEVCWQVLLHGQQFQRAAAAMELSFLEPDTALFPIEAPGFRQWEWLSAIQNSAVTAPDHGARSTIPHQFVPKARSSTNQTNLLLEPPNAIADLSTIPISMPLSQKRTISPDSSLEAAISALAEITKPISHSSLFRRRHLPIANPQLIPKITSIALAEEPHQSEPVIQQDEITIPLPKPTSATIHTARNLLSARKTADSYQGHQSNPQDKAIKSNPAISQNRQNNHYLISLSSTTFEWYFQRIAEIWQMRYAVATSRYALFSQLCEIDNHLRSYLDYLPDISETLWNKVESFPEDKWKAGHLFAASFIALKANKIRWLYKVINVALNRSRINQGIISVLGWLPDSSAKTSIDSLLKSKFIRWRRLGMTAAIANHLDCKDFLGNFINDPDAQLNALALKAIGKLGYTHLIPILLRNLRSKQEEHRFWAAWSAVLLGNREAALEMLKGFALSSMPLRRQHALQLILRIADQRDTHRWMSLVTQYNRSLHFAMINTGVCNYPSSIPWLIESISVPERACFAAEAFTLLTGIDLFNEGMMRPRVIHPSESEPLASMELTRFFLPDQISVQAWWDANQHRYQKDVRYLFGQKVALENCMWIFKNGRQYQREAVALEMSLLKKEFSILDTQAASFRQYEWINQLGTS